MSPEHVRPGSVAGSDERAPSQLGAPYRMLQVTIVGVLGVSTQSPASKPVTVAAPLKVKEFATASPKCIEKLQAPIVPVMGPFE
jgi:hypothetical protein